MGDTPKWGTAAEPYPEAGSADETISLIFQMTCGGKEMTAGVGAQAAWFDSQPEVALGDLFRGMLGLMESHGFVDADKYELVVEVRRKHGTRARSGAAEAGLHDDVQGDDDDADR